MANPTPPPAARLYHSASSDAIGQRCERAWYYGYREKRREPEISYAEAEACAFSEKPRKPLVLTARVGSQWKAAIKSIPILTATLPTRSQAIDRAILNFYLARSKAVGAAVHDRLENWYHGTPLDTSDLPGQIALDGLPLLPVPEECERGETEHEIGDVPLPENPGGLKTALDFDGILWAGKRDLVARLSKAEWSRIGLTHVYRRVGGERWIVIDYKTTAQIYDSAERAGFAKSPEKLAADVQACLYGLATCTELDLPRVAGRWVYFETKKKRQSLAVDLVLERSRCADVVGEATVRARRLDLIRDEKDAAQNPEACADYGGCPHHYSAGGPCNAEPAISFPLPPPRPEKNEMALTKESTSKFTKKKPTADVEPEETPAPKRGRGRPKKVVDAEPEPEPDIGEPEDSASTEEDFTWPGNHGELRFSGDARDVLAVVKLLRAAEQA